jgi:DNA-binding winged helix-turn-helix (wHTH) protein
MAHVSYRFGPFLVDRDGYRAFRDGRPLALTSQQLELLLFLVEHADTLVTKDALLEAVWPDANVTENALTQAMSDLRQALGDRARSPRYIRTIARRGYRFVAHVDRVTSDAVLQAPAVPHAEQGAALGAPAGEPNPVGTTGVEADRNASTIHSPSVVLMVVPVRDTPSLDAAKAWSEGWLKIETLDTRELRAAITDFARAIALDPRHAAAYAALAVAEGAVYEDSRYSPDPDDSALARAIAHARRAIELDESLAEAHATLAMLLVSTWQTPEAVASARRAVALESWQWRHYFRLCYAGWGDVRLEAAARALALYPAFAFAHFQMAMVYVARGQLAQADTVLLHGVAVQDQQIERRQRFPALGLHWLRGLVLLAQQDPAQALAEFDRELTLADVHRLYGREYQMAALLGRASALIRVGRVPEALRACDEALALYPTWPACHLHQVEALTAAGEKTRTEQALAAAESVVTALEKRRPIEGMVARAQLLAARGQPDDGAAVLLRLVREAPPGFAGWAAPVDPLLAPLRAASEMSRVLHLVAERAR